MTTTSDLLNHLHKKNNTNHPLNQFYFNDMRTSHQKPTTNTITGLKKPIKKIIYQADRVSISPIRTSRNGKNPNKSKITVSKHKNNNYNKKTSSPLYRTVNTKKLTGKSVSKESRSITPTSRSISVTKPKPDSKSKFKKATKSPINKLNNLHTISNLSLSSKTPLSSGGKIKNSIRKTPSPLRINTVVGKSPNTNNSLRKTPILKRTSYNVKSVNRVKSTSKSKSPTEIRGKSGKIKHVKINSNSNFSHKGINSNHVNTTINVNHVRKQSSKPKTNINLNSNNPISSIGNPINSIGHNNKKTVTKVNKSKNHFRHISISTSSKASNFEEQTLKSNSSRNSTPNQGATARPPISVINSTRTGSVSSKSLPVTKKISSISHISKTGFNGFHVTTNKKNTPKVNQDNFFIEVFEDINTQFIGVCDGHGANGHLISTYIKDNLPSLLHKELKERLPFNASPQSARSISLSYPIHKSIENSFILANSKLSNNINIDTNFSGSTCSSIIITHDAYFSANVGDSRAIKGTCINSLWNYEPLTRDHKATEPDEAKRIIRFGGRIESFKETDGSFVGPKRVWLQKEQIPGLAMTRSFGDQIASSVGVVCEPEIRDFFWKEEDRFIIIASDGLWEYVSNKEVVEIGSKYYGTRNSEKACENLYNLAHQRWRENDDCIDDITIIVIYLD